MMPMLLLTVRLEIDVIFQTTYPKFYQNLGPSGAKVQSGGTEKKGKEKDPYYVRRAKRLINGVLSDLLDPNLVFSRMSFLESGKEAIDIKEGLRLGKRVGF